MDKNNINSLDKSAVILDIPTNKFLLPLLYVFSAYFAVNAVSVVFSGSYLSIEGSSQLFVIGLLIFLDVFFMRTSKVKLYKDKIVLGGFFKNSVLDVQSISKLRFSYHRFFASTILIFTTGEKDEFFKLFTGMFFEGRYIRCGIIGKEQTRKILEKLIELNPSIVVTQDVFDAYLTQPSPKIVL